MKMDATLKLISKFLLIHTFSILTINVSSYTAKTDSVLPEFAIFSSDQDPSWTFVKITIEIESTAAMDHLYSLLLMIILMTLLEVYFI